MAIISDFSHLFSRAVYAQKLDIINNYDYAAHCILTTLLNGVDKFGASVHNKMIIATDSKPSWRKTWYEANKPQTEDYKDQSYKGKRVKDAEFDWERLYAIQNDILDTLDKYSDFQVIRAEGAEGDDIVAILSKLYTEKKEQCIVEANDKDFKQIQNQYVKVYDPIKKMFFPEIDIQRFKELHCMIGDKSDNILAIRPRLGEKTAEKLHPTLVEILATDPDAREKYLFNSVLIDFDNIPEYIITNILVQHEKPFMNYNAMELAKMFQRYGLANIGERISSFKLHGQVKDTAINTFHDKQKKFEEYTDNTVTNFFL